MSVPMSDCHDWFAEVAESYVRYLIAKAEFEVFGQSEWGADLALRDSVTNLWVRCEVRSSDCNDEPRRKKSSKLADRAELTASVSLNGTALRVTFHKLDATGKRIQRMPGAMPVHYVYEDPIGFREWLRVEMFTAGTAECEVTAQ